MKPSIVTLFTLLPCALHIGAVAQTPAAPAPAEVSKAEPRIAPLLKARWNVRVEVQMVAMPEDRALQLLPELQSDKEAQVESACGQIQDMIKKKEAVLLGWPFLITLDGERGVSESIVEKKYPTDFDPPTEPQNITSPAVPAPAPKNVSLVPSGWEVRNCGETIEATPKVLEGGKRILLETVPQRVELLRFETYDTGKTRDGSVTQVVQPEFATQKYSGSLIVASGRHVLIGFHKLSLPAGQIEFFILKAVALPLD